MLAVDRRAIARHRESYSAELALWVQLQLHPTTELDLGNIMYRVRGRVIRLITSDDAYSAYYARGSIMG